MSWGYLVDLRCSLASRSWIALKKKRLADFQLDDDWSRMRDPALRHYFAPVSGKDAKTPFSDVLEWPVFREECLREETRESGAVHVRVALALDRSQLDLAAYLGALLAGVQSAGGEGKLALINDGSYAGEQGHELVVRSGKCTKRALRNYQARREKLLMEIYPDLEDDEVESDAPQIERRPAPPPVEKDEPADPVAAMSVSLALYNQGSPARARDRLDAFFAAGGTPSSDLMTNYTGFLRVIPPKRRDALERAFDRVLGILGARRDLRAHAPLLENAVAFLNENGRAAESVDLVLRAVSEGLQWTPVLAANTTYSAVVAKDVTRARELVGALRDVAEGDALNGQPLFFENWASLHLLLGDRDAAMRALERCVSLAPDRRSALVADSDYTALHSHPRWPTLGRRPR